MQSVVSGQNAWVGYLCDSRASSCQLLLAYDSSLYMYLAVAPVTSAGGLNLKCVNTIFFVNFAVCCCIVIGYNYRNIQ